MCKDVEAQLDLKLTDHMYIFVFKAWSSPITRA